MNLSERLVELRKERNLSQLELAEALNVSRQSISLWEKGSTAPSLDKLPLLAEFYGITIDELFYSPEEMPKDELQEIPQQSTRKRSKKTFWLGTAAIVVLLAIGILIGTQVSDFVHKNEEKKPIPISEIEGIYIPPEEFGGYFELIPVE